MMVLQTSFFCAINYYDQAKVGAALLHTQGTPNTEYADASLGLQTDQGKGNLTDPVKQGTSRHRHHRSPRQAVTRYPHPASGTSINI